MVMCSVDNKNNNSLTVLIKQSGFEPRLRTQC